MYCTIAQIRAGVEEYIRREILPVLLDGGEKALASACQSKAAQLMGIVTADGAVNVDVARNLMIAVIPEHGLPVTMPGGLVLTFKREDVDALYKYVTKAP